MGVIWPRLLFFFLSFLIPSFIFFIQFFIQFHPLKGTICLIQHAMKSKLCLRICEGAQISSYQSTLTYLLLDNFQALLVE
jgi:hypothetical protein